MMGKPGPQGRIDAMMGLSGKAAGASAAVFRGAMEADAVAAVLARATPPADVGPVPVAPARGAMRIETEREVVNGLTKRVLGKRLEQADVFDLMIAQARRRHGDAAGFVAPFTPGQVYMARHYRGLTERHAAGGVRCASLEAGREGGSGGDFMDAYLAVGRELDRLHGRIGPGQALVLRRVRPSQRGSRVGISDRSVVDMVCLAGMTPGGVLQAHGWSVKVEYLAGVRTALCGALDRMQGYDLQRGAR
jgi:hypothetical protein